MGYDYDNKEEIKTKYRMLRLEYLKLQNTTLKKYIPIENDKDNAN